MGIILEELSTIATKTLITSLIEMFVGGPSNKLSLKVGIKHDLHNLLKSVQAEQKAHAVAASRALNTAARGLRTDAVRELRKRYPPLKARDVNSLISLRFATPANLTALVIARGRPVSLMRFLTKSETKRGGGGVWVDVTDTNKFIPHAWVQSMSSKGGDYQVIFMRQGPGRLPVKALKTIDVPSAMNISEVREALNNMADARYEKEFERQMHLFYRSSSYEEAN